MKINDKLRIKLRNFISNIAPRNSYDNQHWATRDDIINEYLESLIKILKTYNSTCTRPHRPDPDSDK